MLKNLTILLLTATWFTSAIAQIDPQFSQFYASPLLVNPGYTGSVKEHRVVFNGRIQWPNLPEAYQTMAFSYDLWRPDLRSGFGIHFLTDKAGSGGFRYTTVRFNYSYKIIMNGWVLSPGMYFGYGSESLDVDKLVFGDQLDFGLDNLPVSQDPNLSKVDNHHFFDTGVGFLLYNKSTWLGSSVYQLNQPNASIMGGESQWPMRIVFHGGIRIPLYGDRYRSEIVSSLAPSIMYRLQGGTQQLDMGVQYHVSPVIVGLWYRGIPILKNPSGNPSNEALIISMGLLFDYFEFAYSYDFTISELASHSGGAHEVSLMYEFGSPNRKKVKRKDQYLPCPTFIEKSKSKYSGGMFRRN
ncbi:MAG: type IX secretion system membrane protein PorP/SprF, partial [Bacteroidota bacterium]